MEKISINLEGVFIIKNKIFDDRRGVFYGECTFNYCLTIMKS